MGQHIEKHDTTTNPIRGDPATTTKGQQLEMVETYRYSKRHQGRSKEGRRCTPIYKGSMCGLTGRINYSRTLGKTQ